MEESVCQNNRKHACNSNAPTWIRVIIPTILIKVEKKKNIPEILHRQALLFLRKKNKNKKTPQKNKTSTLRFTKNIFFLEWDLSFN